MIVGTLLAIFALALAAPSLHRVLGRATGYVLALGPLVAFGYYLTQMTPTAAGEATTVAVAWAESLGVEFSFRVDSLSTLFALLVTGVGTAIVLYSNSYLEGHPKRGRFFGYLLGFMGAMLGLVLADDLILLFIFWELTSITSYLLIGFDHEREKARKSALQALVVTGLGGLSMLAGLVLLGQIAGTFSVSGIIENYQVLAESPLTLAAMILVLGGAFTKSAQFPFHFWLPNAMEAPSPVSAYLHSSTMVKAGVYLVARLNPAFTEDPAWQWALAGFGGATMLLGAYMATRQTYYKKVLAYTTVSSLGIMVMLIGLGAPQAAAAYILAHALFKGALFLVAGIVDHEAGVKDTEQMGGLFGKMPVTALVAIISGLSMAGMVPLLGFVAKELLLKGSLHAHGGPHDVAWLWPTISTIAGAFMAVAGFQAGIRPFLMKRTAEGEYPKPPHEAPPPMLLGPVVLTCLTLVGGLVPALFAKPIINGTTASIAGAKEVELVKLSAIYMATHASTALLLSGIALVAGAVLFFLRGPWRAITAPLDRIGAIIGPERIYHLLFAGTVGSVSLATIQTKLLQSGYLRVYVQVTVLTVLALGGGLMVLQGDLVESISVALPKFGEIAWTELLFEAVLVFMICVAAIASTQMRGRLSTIAVLGVVGYCSAVIFVLFGAPDVAMTQFAVETLTVIIFVLVVYHLPRFSVYSSKKVKSLDALLGAAFGLMMAAFVVSSFAIDADDGISWFYNRYALPSAAGEHVAYGRNLVNIILVDFRAIDTLGEIVVLGLAAVGVYTLLKLRQDRPAQGGMA
ncbi:MAG: proton-conducting transporter membrane subunit [Phycisphaerales bacterium]